MVWTINRRTVEYPLSLDLKYYRAANSDLTSFNDDQLTAHFREYGKNEGRAGSACCFRESFLRLISADEYTLEIGPFCGPQLRGKKVKYFDIADRDALIKKANEVQYPFTDAPSIDYVSDNGDMSVIDDHFDQVFSSHNIEHLPNLIGHLCQVSRILRSDGSYFLIVPDKRFCFDHFLSESTIAEVLGSHIEQKNVHYAKSVLEHRHLITHNDPLRHWQGDHGAPWVTTQHPDAIIQSIDYIAKNANTYLDTHAWHFTPDTFANIVTQLNKLDLIDLQIERIYNTPHGRFEFCVVLAKN